MQTRSVTDILDSNPALKIRHESYNINVTTEKGTRITPDQVLKQFREHQGAGQEAHLYFHLPLCNYICRFCNYVKTRAPNGNQLEVDLDFWVDAWQQEALSYLNQFSWISNSPIHSIYFGGGTAALLKKRHLEDMIDFARANYLVKPGAEISLEGNPDNFSAKEIQDAVNAGINRFSIGVQSLQDEVLKFSGRGHSAAMALDSIRAMNTTGLPYNVDMMFGLPHQTPAAVENDIRQLIELSVPTITIYRLRNADREKMGIGNRSAWNNDRIREEMERKLLFPQLHETYEMRSRIVALLRAADYEPTPCGWWTRKGTYPNGNIPKVSKAKWEKYETMLAYGPGVYGWLAGNRDNFVQTHNVTDIHAYRQATIEGRTPLAYGREINGYAALATRLGFAFKSNQPIHISKIEQQFGVNLWTDAVTAPVLNELVERGLLKSKEDSISLSAEGEFLHEELISVYVHERIGGFGGEICQRSTGSGAHGNC